MITKPSSKFDQQATRPMMIACGVLILAAVLGCLSLKLGGGLLVTLTLIAIAEKTYSLLQKARLPEGWIRFICVVGALLMLCAAASLGSIVIKFIAEQGRAVLPDFFEQLRLASKRTSINALKPLADIGDAQFFEYIRSWAFGQLSLWMSVTGNSLRFLAHVFFAGLITISTIMRTRSHPYDRPGGLAMGLGSEGARFLKCFSYLLTAQLYIAFWNTSVTLIYIYFLLPLFHINLPLREVLIISTFTLSFIPALGNILANSLMVVLCLQFPPWVLILSLIYLVAVHKTEYLINAKILSSAYQASVAELLICIVVGETMFGLPGLILAPVIYLYLKDFLNRMGFL